MKNRNEYGNGPVAGIRYYGDYAVERFNDLDRQRKFLFVAGAVLVTVIVVVLCVFVASPHYVPLYTNLEAQDAASIAAYLKNNKIPYKIADDGSTIMVPDSQKYQVRLDLVNNNLPEGNIVGFESFNQTHFGETETDEQVRYIAALQGELERTISKIDGVEDVRVHVVEPQPALFAQDQNVATASVLLKLTLGYNLQDSQVLGITRLVAGGVEGLKPENVTVIDTSGNILSDDLQDAGQGQLSTDQMKIKQNYEKQLEDSIQSMLAPVVGPGKVIVRANATLNFDQITIDTQNYGDKQVQSDHTIEETDTGNTTASGAPGTSSNIPTYQEAGAQGGGQTQKTDKTTNYDVNTQTEHQVVTPGQLKQLSLSVVVDGQLDPTQQKQIEDMVASAAGIIPTRGDKLTVAGMPFNNEVAIQAQQAMNLAERQHFYLNVFYILLAIIGAFLVYRFAQKLVTQYGQQAQDVQSYPGGTSVEDLLASKQLEIKLSDDKAETQKILDQLRAVARSKPDETVIALRSWLTGD